jgi:hypothetical protein
VKEFAEDKNVAFADVNLREAPIRGNHSPGAGGWPTVRYFNKETGYEGRSYAKKTSKAMCEELGDQEYMRSFVKEAGAPPVKCDVATGDNCKSLEASYIKQWKAKSREACVTESTVLAEQIADPNQTNGFKKWAQQRLDILTQLSTHDEL